MRTHLLPSLIATLTAVLTLSACDDGEEPVGCAEDDCDDKMDPDDGGDDDDGDAESNAEDSAPPAEGGGPGPVATPECESLCACVEGLGADGGSCSQQCNADMADADPDDRAQCVGGVTAAGFMDCAVECEAFPDGS